MPTLIDLIILSNGFLVFVIMREELSSCDERCGHLLRPILHLVEFLKCR